MKHNVKKDKIEQALELINQAAHEKKDELYEMIGDRYANVRDLLSETAKNGKDTVDHAKKQFVKSLHNGEAKMIETAKKVNKKIHQEPWVLIGAIALGSIFLGYKLAHKK